MTMDGVCLFAALAEIRERLLDARIQNIHQPARDQVVLTLRSRTGNSRLLLCTAPDASRIHITSQQDENPPQPPVFCMLLRKYLTGARLVKVTQPGLERIADFLFTASDELGDRREVHLIAEVMGKHSNIILADGNHRIIDSMKRIPASVSSVRQVLAGLAYVPPPGQDRHDALSMPVSAFEELLSDVQPSGRMIAKLFDGISASTAEEIAAFTQSAQAKVSRKESIHFLRC